MLLFLLNFLFDLLHMEEEETLRLWKLQKTAHGDLCDISIFLLITVRVTKNQRESERKSTQTEEGICVCVVPEQIPAPILISLPKLIAVSTGAINDISM